MPNTASFLGLDALRKEASATLFSLDMNTRLGIVLGSLVFLTYWVHSIVGPARVGWQRISRSVPAFFIILFVTCLFRTNVAEESMTAGYCVVNYLWLSTLKIYAFCTNRGQLTKSYDSGSLSAFVISLLCPVVVTFDEKRVDDDEKGEDKEKHAHKDVRFILKRLSGGAMLMEAVYTLVRVLSKGIAVWYLSRGAIYLKESGQHFWRDVYMTWFLYSYMSMLEDVHSLLFLLIFRTKLGVNYDQPWLSQSFKEFWSRRYNVVFGETFRGAIYEPVSEGCWIRGTEYFEKNSTFARMLLALLAAFTASGVVHALVGMYLYSIPFPIKYCMFFVLHGGIVAVEVAVKAVLKKSGLMPRTSSFLLSLLNRVYLFVVMFFFVHTLFWTEYNEHGVTEIILKNGLSCIGVS